MDWLAQGMPGSWNTYQGREVNYGLDVFLAWFHPSLRDMMGQIGYFLTEEVALRWLKLQVVFVESVKHHMEMLEVLRFRL